MIRGYTCPRCGKTGECIETIDTYAAGAQPPLCPDCWERVVIPDWPDSREVSRHVRAVWTYMRRPE